MKKSTKNLILKISKIAGGVIISLMTLVFVLGVTLLAAVYLIEKGGSSVLKETLVNVMSETGALKFCPTMFLTDEEVAEIRAKSEVVVPEGDTDTSLIIIEGEEGETSQGESKKSSSEDEELGIVYDDEGVCLQDIKGKTYVGKILIVKDPTRVEICGLSEYGTGIVGKTTEQMAEENDALAAVNGGGYEEMSDYKTGGIPQGREESGVVILDGELKWGDMDTTYEIIGLDSKGFLIVDNMTPRQALDKGIVSALNWGPILVKNGEPCVIQSESVNPGFHPRTAIGQRADGSIILLVIDGRQSHSMGASYDDLIEIMVRYGAVNAANLDGGMSSYMVYKGEVITSPYMLYFGGKRTVATSVIVTKKEN